MRYNSATATMDSKAKMSLVRRAGKIFTSAMAMQMPAAAGINRKGTRVTAVAR